ncbi:MAG: hypothetical protein R8M45_05430 [Ghiorsea sp.]
MDYTQDELEEFLLQDLHDDDDNDIESENHEVQTTDESLVESYVKLLIGENDGKI